MPIVTTCSTRAVYCPGSRGECEMLSGFLAKRFNRLGIWENAVLKHRRLQGRTLLGIGVLHLIMYRLHNKVNMYRLPIAV